MTARELAIARDRIARARLAAYPSDPVEVVVPAPKPKPKPKSASGPIKKDPFVIWLEKFDVERRVR